MYIFYGQRLKFVRRLVNRFDELTISVPSAAFIVRNTNTHTHEFTPRGASGAISPEVGSPGHNSRAHFRIRAWTTAQGQWIFTRGDPGCLHSSQRPPIFQLRAVDPTGCVFQSSDIRPIRSTRRVFPVSRIINIVFRLVSADIDGASNFFFR